MQFSNSTGRCGLGIVSIETQMAVTGAKARECLPQGCATVFLTAGVLPTRHPSQAAMTKDCGTKNYDQLWKGSASAVDKARAIQTLGEILADPEGRGFVSRLDSKNARLCIEILDQVSRIPVPRLSFNRLTLSL